MNEQSTKGFKVRTCDQDECTGSGSKSVRRYVDCPAHVQSNSTTTLLFDSDLHYVAFVNLDNTAEDEEFWCVELGFGASRSAKHVYSIL